MKQFLKQYTDPAKKYYTDAADACRSLLGKCTDPVTKYSAELWGKARARFSKVRENHPRAAWILAGSAVVLTITGLSWLTGITFFIPSLVTGGLIVSGVVAVAGVASYIAEERRNNAIKVRENEAGQNIQGPQLAMKTLEAAQEQIISLTKKYNQAAALPPNVQESINSIINGCKEALAKVKVLYASPSNPAGDQQYRFIRKKAELVN